MLHGNNLWHSHIYRINTRAVKMIGLMIWFALYLTACIAAICIAAINTEIKK